MPVLLFVVLVGLAVALKVFSPKQPSRTPDNAPQMSVKTQVLAAQNYQVNVESYGTVSPRTQSLLVAQIAGQIVQVSDDFDNGGFFKAGDSLLTIDDRDYRADVKIAEAQLLAAQAALEEEKAQSELALRDWKSLGRANQPNDFLLRKPQLKAAEANLISAQSNLEKVRLDLERTTIVAPYDGRVMSSNVDLGQVVSVNSVLGEIYAISKLEVRLPIRDRDLAYIDLPEVYIDTQSAGQVFPRVELFSGLVANQVWQGAVVRTESAIDSTSRQLHVIAEIDDPYATADAEVVEFAIVPATSRQSLVDRSKGQAGRQPQIKIGQYVTAKVAGKVLENAIVIPVSAIYQGSFVYVVEEGLLQRKPIRIAWQNEVEALIGDGLAAGQELVLSSLGQVFSGTPVLVVKDETSVTKIADEPQAKPLDISPATSPEAVAGD